MEVTRFRGRIQSVEKALAMAVIRRQPKQVSTTRTRERSKLWPPSGNDAGRTGVRPSIASDIRPGPRKLADSTVWFQSEIADGPSDASRYAPESTAPRIGGSGMLFEAGMGLSMAWNRFWERLWKSIHPNRCIELHGPILAARGKIWISRVYVLFERWR